MCAYCFSIIILFRKYCNYYLHKTIVGDSETIMSSVVVHIFFNHSTHCMYCVFIPETYRKTRLVNELRSSCLNLSSNCILARLIQKCSEK